MLKPGVSLNAPVDMSVGGRETRTPFFLLGWTSCAVCPSSSSSPPLKFSLTGWKSSSAPNDTYTRVTTCSKSRAVRWRLLVGVIARRRVTRRDRGRRPRASGSRLGVWRRAGVLGNTKKFTISAWILTEYLWVVEKTKHLKVLCSTFCHHFLTSYRPADPLK